MALTAEQARTAIKSPNQLKRWLEESGRRYLVFDSLDLVDALEWPLEVEQLQRLITAYRERRQTIPTGQTEKQKNPATGEVEDITIFKTDVLTDEEKAVLITQLSDELKMGVDHATVDFLPAIMEK